VIVPTKPRPEQECTAEDAALQRRVNSNPALQERGMRVSLWHETGPEGVNCCAMMKIGGRASGVVRQPSPFNVEELVQAAKECHREFLDRMNDVDPYSSDPGAAYGGWPSDLR
jgi:hypothetical protein